MAQHTHVARSPMAGSPWELCRAMGFLEPSVVLQPQLRSATIRELETHSSQSLLKNPCLYYPGRPCWTEVCKEGPDL